VPLFLSLIQDLFPGLSAEKAKHPSSRPRSAARWPRLGLQPHASWLHKVVQVYEMALVRHSLMLVGPSGVGKSSIVSALHAALQAAPASEDGPAMVGAEHREVRMNPKAITAPQMFGSLDVIANEWTEGIFASLWRKANKDKRHFTWIVLDGPVDAIWIENLNTVMDDNRILTLANNDRIPMLRPNVTLHFEVEDLRNASPATVSRAGIIYVSRLSSAGSPSWRPGSKATQAGIRAAQALVREVHRPDHPLHRARVQAHHVGHPLGARLQGLLLRRLAAHHAPGVPQAEQRGRQAGDPERGPLRTVLHLLHLLVPGRHAPRRGQTKVQR
jgi:dynein heavy chain